MDPATWTIYAVYNREVNQIDFKRRLTQHNLFYDEQRVLRKLKNRTMWWSDRRIRAGGLCCEENRSVHSYKEIPGDPTKSS